MKQRACLLVLQTAKTTAYWRQRRQLYEKTSTYLPRDTSLWINNESRNSEDNQFMKNESTYLETAKTTSMKKGLPTWRQRTERRQPIWKKSLPTWRQRTERRQPVWKSLYRQDSELSEDNQCEKIFPTWTAKTTTYSDWSLSHINTNWSLRLIA